MTLINGEGFDPAKIVSFDWEAILPAGLIIEEDYNVILPSNLEFRSRLANIFRQTPDQWPTDLQSMSRYGRRAREGKPVEYDMAKLGEPMKFRLGSDDDILYDPTGMLRINMSYGNLEVSNNQDSSKGTHLYDPALQEQGWEEPTKDRIKKAVAAYQKLMGKQAKQEAERRKLTMKMDYAHLSQDQKDKIATRFVELKPQSTNPRYIIKTIAEEMCPTSKAFKRNAGKNAIAAALAVLVDKGLLKLSFK
jgi:hypothetical protein